MAATASTDTVKVTFNDVEIDVPKGELVVEAVKRLGLEIPIFCYHPRLKPVGMCRMCLVEVGFKQPDGSVRMMPKPQAGCTLPVSEGMVVKTDSDMVRRDRKGVLEFLLVNHPLDCPICDRGGECPLQNNTLAYGPSTSRFLEMKRHLPKAYPLSQHVTLDLERCIQCGRCVRFTEEISGDSQLAFRFRGASMQPSTFQLTDFESKFSGNVIEICPVGALTNADYRFRARPWDLETKPAICTLTPCGTNIWFDHRAGSFVRANGRTNEDVNEEWTSDRTKFGYGFYNSESRLKAPLLRRGEALEAAGWTAAYDEILKVFKDGADRVGLIVKPDTSNENLYEFQKLFRGVFGSNNIDSRVDGLGLAFDDRTENKGGVDPAGLSIADLEALPAALVLGVNLADKQPMSYLRLRKGWFNQGSRIVAATSEPTELDSFAHVILRYKPGTERALVAALMSLAGVQEASKISHAQAAAECGVEEAKLKEAAVVLKQGAAFITSSAVLASPQGAAATDLLAAWAALSTGKFASMTPWANSRGSELLGVLPDTLPGGTKSAQSGLGTRAMLQAAADGKIKGLWLMGTDPLADFPDRQLAQKALENVEFLVVQDALVKECTAYASVVLPSALPAEQDGTYTSVERRVQRMQAILKAPGQAKPAWRIATEAGLRATPGTPRFNSREIFAEIASVVPAFEGMSYETICDTGNRLPTVVKAQPDVSKLTGTLAGI